MPYNKVPDEISVPDDVAGPDSILSPADRTTAVITADGGLVLRKAPGKEGAREDVVPLGVTVTVLGNDGGDWLFTCYHNKFGWVKKEYTTLGEDGGTTTADPDATYDAMLRVMMQLDGSAESWDATLGDYDSDGMDELIVYKVIGHPVELWKYVDATQNGPVVHDGSAGFMLSDPVQPVTSKETGERLAASGSIYQGFLINRVSRISANGIEDVDSWSTDCNVTVNGEVNHNGEVTNQQFEDCYTFEKCNAWEWFIAPITEADARAFLDGKDMN